MRDARQTLTDSWAQARARLSAAEQRAQTSIAELAAKAKVAPEGLRRFTSGLSEQLKDRREALQKATAEALKRTAGRFLLASREEVDALRRRVEDITARVDEMKGAAEEPEAERKESASG